MGEKLLAGPSRVARGAPAGREGAPAEDERRRTPDAGPTRPGWSRTRTAGGLQPEEPERLDGDPEGEEEPEEEHGDQRDAAQVLGPVDVLLGRARRQQAAGGDAASAELVHAARALQLGPGGRRAAPGRGG